MGSARLSSHDPRCYHPQCSSALCCCELLPWSRVTEAAVILSITAAVGWLCGLKHWWAESMISAEQQVLLTLMPLLQEHWLWREKEGWTDGVIMPSATLAGLPKPPASSNSISALYPHKWIFCFSNTSKISLWQTPSHCPVVYHVHTQMFKNLSQTPQVMLC